jgi:glucose-6-phosphate isomerase
MKNIEYSFDNALVSSKDLSQLSKRLELILEKISSSLSKKYETEFASLALPFDDELFQKVTELADKKRKLNPKIMVVIGIGGSNLGAMAVYSACKELADKSIQVYWADTIDSDKIYAILNQCENALKKNHEIILCVISKSGSTFETIINFECFLTMLKIYKKDSYHQNIVVITELNSNLYKKAQSENFDTLQIPKLVGGRYSVLSAVGLFPLALLDIDIEKLRKGAAFALEQSLQSIEQNPAAKSAGILYLLYEKGFHIHDLFFFSPALENLGKWYRQLVGESLGKQKEISGKKINIGFTPTVSIGTTDLHSVAQLYLAGPSDKITTFIEIEKNNHDLMVDNKSLTQLMHGIFKAVTVTFAQEKRPFIALSIPEKNPYYIGQFLQYAMMQTILLGNLFEINPFDQPQVELYKNEMKKILDLK